MLEIKYDKSYFRIKDNYTVYKRWKSWNMTKVILESRTITLYLNVENLEIWQKLFL